MNMLLACSFRSGKEGGGPADVQPLHGRLRWIADVFHLAWYLAEPAEVLVCISKG